jgi:hypothetical protein
MMVLVYSESDSPRLRYAFGLIFKDILGLELDFTQSLEEFISADTIKVNYSDTALEDILGIRPSEIIFETGIQNQAVSVDEWEGIPVFFARKGSDPFPFDPIAMTFYLVSRYEEYIPGQRDLHGRFMPEYSLAYQHGFLESPLVNTLAMMIREQLEFRYPDHAFPKQHYRFQATVDIDQAFAHKGKGFIRSLGGLAKLMLNLNFGESVNKLKVIAGSRPDPYDNFEFQARVFEEYGLKPVYFVLIGNYGKYDKNSPHRNPAFRRLIKKLSGKAEIGIHPSYGSYDKLEMLAVESDRLKNITGKEVRLSRQHFLRMKMPDTYRNLVDRGITDDYSMGYASVSGFRASIATPFKAFDLIQNKELPLRIHPFAFMDSAFSDYMKLLPGDYIKFVSPLISRVRKAGGTLVGIWHNYSLADDEEKHKAFREVIKRAVHDQAPQA